MASFCFIDTIEEVKAGESLTATFTLTGSEEFLKDHFEGFPVMPGVLQLEALRQAASTLLGADDASGKLPFRLVWAEDLRFGRFVKPGTKLWIRVWHRGNENGAHVVEGRIEIAENGPPARVLSARFGLVPVNK